MHTRVRLYLLLPSKHTASICLSNRGVTNVAFSPDGQLVASLGLDNDHSLAVYDWRKKAMLFRLRHRYLHFSSSYSLLHVVPALSAIALVVKCVICVLEATRTALEMH